MANSAEDVKLQAPELISLLLKEPKILQKIVLAMKPKARSYTNWKVVVEEERIYLGKYSWHGFGEFWNNLIKCCDHISFDDFYIKVWDALLEMTAGNEKAHIAVLEGLSREVVLQGIHAKDQNILHRFFDVCRHATSDGFWKDKGLKQDNPPHHHFKGCPFSGDVEIEVQPHGQPRPTMFKVVDAVGDAFEVMSVRWLGGRG